MFSYEKSCAFKVRGSGEPLSFGQQLHRFETAFEYYGDLFFGVHHFCGAKVLLQKERHPYGCLSFWSGRRGLLAALPGRHTHTGTKTCHRHVFLAALVPFRASARLDQKETPPIRVVFFWSGRRGSNSLPRPWQGRALPDELRPHNNGYYKAWKGCCQAFFLLLPIFSPLRSL